MGHYYVHFAFVFTLKVSVGATLKRLPTHATVKSSPSFDAIVKV